MTNEKTKRCFAHDYHSPCIYLVTVSVEGRKPLLGRVVGTAEDARIEPSKLGWAIWREIEKIPTRWTQVRVLQHQIMPDHVHLVLYVTERLPDRWSLGNIVAAWKQACGRVYSDICGLKTATPNSSSCDLKATTPNNLKARTSAPNEPNEGTSGSLGEAAFRPPYQSLFSKGFNDTILTGQDQLHHMMAYVRDNPRRLLVKQQNSDYFRIHRGLLLKGSTCDVIGNLALLQRPLLAVHCRRRWTDTEHTAFYNRCLAGAQRGMVLIGAFISPYEKIIMKAANEYKYPIIQLLDNGIPSLYKPYGDAFYAMAEGRLLQLAPFPYSSATHTITREQCNQLNQLSEALSQCHN